MSEGLRSGRLKLVPRDALVRTGPVDHADWNYRPVLGAIERVRFRLALQMLPVPRPATLLELGYGSGVFLPSLAECCEELLGVDVHPMASEVEAMLSRLGVRARLHSASASAIPLPPRSVDCAVAVSALEFVDDLDAVCREVTRLLRPGGRFVVVTPGDSPVVDAGLRVLTGKSARQDFGSRRALIVPTLLHHFRERARRIFPPPVGVLPRLYTALQLSPKRESAQAAQ